MHARLSALTVAALLLVSCGGGGSAPSLPKTPVLQAPTASPSSAPAPTSAPMQQVTFKIVIPAASSSAHRPAYVSASTQSASVTVTPSGGSAGSPTTVNCTTVCSGTVSAPVGADTFAMNLYDAKNGVGDLLSTGATTQTIVAGQANSVNVTFNGVVHALSVSVGAATAGTASSPALGVNALDADGNTIVGPGSYVSASGAPVTLAIADSDASRATTLPTQTSFTAPATGLTLAYTGLAIAPATLTVSAAGFSNATALFAPTLQPIVITTTDAANPGFKGVDLYAAAGAGAGSTGSFTATEAGFTNAPYSRSLNLNVPSGCSTIATVNNVTTTYTANSIAGPTAGMCSVMLSDTAGQSQGVPIYYTNYSYSGGDASLIVPNGVTSLNAQVGGGQGGGSSSNLCVGGAGWIAQLTSLAVTSGHNLNIQAGGVGQNWDLGNAQAGKGGFGGGGNAGSAGTTGTGGGGGGASAIFDVTTGGTPLIVGGGGGGGAGGCVAGTTAGTGGGLATGGSFPNGGGGEFSIVGGFPGGLPGGGGSTSTATVGGGGPGDGGTTGAAGTGPAAAGSVGVGGMGGALSGTGGSGGGGGGGYFGGGGGGGASTGLGGGAGGGGSSFPSTATFFGINFGFGYVIIIF